MLQARIHGPDDVRLDEVPEPTPGPRDVVLRVAACGICGTDLGYIRLGGLMGPSPEPMPIGHELSGVVEAVGGEVAEYSPGDRVTLDPSGEFGSTVGNGAKEAGFAPLLLVRDVAGANKLHKLPDAMSFDIAALTEPLGVGMNAVDKVAIAPGEKAVVFGAGPIGLAAVASLRDQGAGHIVSVDLSPQRLALAEKLGAHSTINPGEHDTWKRLRAIHGEVDFMGSPVAASNAFVEASGASQVILDVIGNVRQGARLAVVALHREPFEISFLQVLMRELQINGAIEYPADFSRGIDLLARADLSPMITHRFALEDFVEAVAVAKDTTVAGKVMIEL